MNTTYILDAVKQEIARLQKVADLLETPISEPLASNTPKRKGHVWSAAGRAEMSRKLRASWKARNSGKKSKK